jgi:hypothetical protein
MTSKFKGVAIAAVFLVGCAVGGASSRLMVPSAVAQQPQPQPPPGARRWEYFCEEVPANAATQTNATNLYGADFWELTLALDQGRVKTWCFKRPMA